MKPKPGLLSLRENQVFQRICDSAYQQLSGGGQKELGLSQLEGIAHKRKIKGGLYGGENPYLSYRKQFAPIRPFKEDRTLIQSV